jgi:lysozyme family protein
MANFNTAIPFILAHEGGFTRTPAGEVVNRGVNTDTLVALGYKGTKEELGKIVENLTLAETEVIYKQNYWTFRKPSIPDALDRVMCQAVASKILDMAVLSGQATAVKLAQRALKIAEDGHFGPATLAVVNATGAGLVPLLIKTWSASLSAIADLRIAESTAAKNDTLVAYWTRVKTGWLGRAAWNGEAT